MCNLKYEEVRNDVRHGACTDFDFIYILSRLVHQLPDRFQRFIQISGILFEKRHEEWRHHRNSLFQQYGLHALACYLIGWCILQRTLPDQFKGPVLYDVQNAPWLYRVPEKLYNKY